MQSRFGVVCIRVSRVFYQTLLALAALGLFVAASALAFILVGSILTPQAMDELGVVAVVAAPVTLALGTANLRIIENARAINEQQSIAYANSFRAQVDELNLAEYRFDQREKAQLDTFNRDYQAVVSDHNMAVPNSDKTFQPVQTPPVFVSGKRPLDCPVRLFHFILF